jgi:hypothetical protein
MMVHGRVARIAIATGVLRGTYDLVMRIVATSLLVALAAVTAGAESERLPTIRVVHANPALPRLADDARVAKLIASCISTAPSESPLFWVQHDSKGAVIAAHVSGPQGGCVSRALVHGVVRGAARAGAFAGHIAIGSSRAPATRDIDDTRVYQAAPRWVVEPSRIDALGAPIVDIENLIDPLTKKLLPDCARARDDLRVGATSVVAWLQLAKGTAPRHVAVAGSDDPKLDACLTRSLSKLKSIVDAWVAIEFRIESFSSAAGRRAKHVEDALGTKR